MRVLPRVSGVDRTCGLDERTQAMKTLGLLIVLVAIVWVIVHMHNNPPE